MVLTLTSCRWYLWPAMGGHLPLLGNRARIHLWTDSGMLLDASLQEGVWSKPGVGACVDTKSEGKPEGVVVVLSYIPLALCSYYGGESDLQNLSSFNV